jgi:hypothetical protein
MSHKEVFSTIINKLLSKYSIKSKLIPTFRYIDNGKTLYIILKFKRKTEYNIYDLSDVYFSITLDEKFPDILPYVRALSSFCFPNLYDNSNLYNSIILFKDSSINSINKDPSLIIDDIISGIPLLLKSIKKNEEKKIFYYYGEYSLDEIYDINDFFSDENLKLYRTHQIIKKNEFKKYIILNDVYFLLFDPLPDSNNYAKLVFMSDILLLYNCEVEEKEKIIHFKWNNNKNETIKMSFKFEDKFFNEFILIKNFKINNLISNYDIKVNDNYNTNGFQISKSFECELLED